MIKYIRILLVLAILAPFYVNEVAAEETLSWNDCIIEAKKHHPDLIAAVENINQERANKTIAASGLFPQLDTSLDFSRQKRTTTSTSSSGTTTSSSSTSARSTITNSYTYGLTGSQLIFDGFKTFNDIGAASEAVKAAQENYRFVSSEVRYNLRSAFINLLKSQELINVAEDIARIRKDDLGLITLRYESGLEHKGALLTAQANLAQANFELSQAKRDVEFFRRQLTKEMGRREFKPMSVTGDFAVRDVAKEKPDLEALIKKHPSILEAAARKKSAQFAVNSAYGNFSPQVSGTAGTSRSGSQWPPRNKGWDLGVSVSMPIFEGGLRFAQAQGAKAAYNETLASERSTKDAAIVDLENAWVALRDAVETVDVQAKALEAAQERSNIAEAQYSTGFISFDNWIIIEDDLVNAKSSYLESQANALLAEANWIQAKGETLEYAQ
ncbi:MAG: TolC family protein [Candidatus Omnitrophota bacterium]